MTSTTGTTQHPDVAEIADLTEGLLSPSRTEDVRRHLDDCPLCADVRVSLEEIRGLLGTLPGPPRMPADIAGRIDAALAAEALLDSTASGAATDVSRETSQPTPTRKTADQQAAHQQAGDRQAADLQASDRQASDRQATDQQATERPVTSRRVADLPTADLPTADRPTADRPAGHARSATGPGRSASRRPRRRAVWGAVLGTAALGLGVLMVQSFQSPHEGASKSQAAADQSGRFSGGPIESRVHTLLSGSGPGHQSIDPPKDKNAPSVDIQESPALPKKALGVPSCIQKGTGRTDTPLATEQGTYQGKQAFLLLLPHASDSSLVQAYVIDAACMGAAPTAKGELLLTDSYPRR